MTKVMNLIYLHFIFYTFNVWEKLNIYMVNGIWKIQGVMTKVMNLPSCLQGTITKVMHIN